MVDAASIKKIIFSLNSDQWNTLATRYAKDHNIDIETAKNVLAHGNQGSEAKNEFARRIMLESADPLTTPHTSSPTAELKALCIFKPAMPCPVMIAYPKYRNPDNEEGLRKWCNSCKLWKGNTQGSITMSADAAKALLNHDSKASLPPMQTHANSGYTSYNKPSSPNLTQGEWEQIYYTIIEDNYGVLECHYCDFGTQEKSEVPRHCHDRHADIIQKLIKEVLHK